MSETFRQRRITGNVWIQDLQGDNAVERLLMCLVDHAHSTPADFLTDIDSSYLGRLGTRTDAGPYRLLPWPAFAEARQLALRVIATRF